MQNVAFLYRRRRTLTVGVMLALGATPLAAVANTFVTNCNDSGNGSLRAAFAQALEGDTVDLTGLTPASDGCANSIITLTTGELSTSHQALTVKGPTTMNLTVTAKDADGIVHPGRLMSLTGVGSGALSIDHLTLSYGLLSGTGSQAGGCVYSKSNLSLSNVRLEHCTVAATDEGGGALGGGAFAVRGAQIVSSVFDSNVASATAGLAWGGGLYLRGGTLQVDRSFITANKADGVVAYGGGFMVSSGQNISITNSTIANNTSAGSFGGVLINRTVVSTSATISNSTISGNTAGDAVGGVSVNSVAVAVQNSTIAFNQAGTLGSATAAGFASVHGGSSGSTSTIELDSSVFSNNTESDGSASDVSISATYTQTTGSHNLIFAPNFSVPADTIVGRCPLLAPLAYNGGILPTLILRSGSPAIDAGSNVANLPFDERGVPFAREVGAAADIGAYEVDQSDIIFNVGFDGCP